MKSKFIILMMAVALTSNVTAQESNVWFDIDFSSNEWLDVFKAAAQAAQQEKDPMYVPDEPGDLYDPYNLNDNGAIDMGNDSPITAGGFTFNFPFHKESAPFTSICGKYFTHDVRFRNNANLDVFFEFPVVNNAKRITLWVANGNETVASHIDFQKSEADEWTNVHTWEVPGNLSYLPVDDEGNPARDLQLTYEINTDEPVALRLHRKEARFLKVYRIMLEKYSGSDVSASFAKKAGLSVSGKTLSLPEAMNNAKLSIYDLAGKQVLNSNVDSDKVELNLHAGVYIVKVVAEQGEMTQKVIVR
jgi:hypothetical protein